MSQTTSEDELPRMAPRREGDTVASSAVTRDHSVSGAQAKLEHFGDWLSKVPRDERINGPDLDDFRVFIEVSMDEVERKALECVRAGTDTVIDVLHAIQRLREERVEEDDRHDYFGLSAKCVRELQAASSTPLILSDVLEVVREYAKCKLGPGVLVKLFTERVSTCLDGSATQVWLGHLKNLDRVDTLEFCGSASSILDGIKPQPTEGFMLSMDHYTTHLRQTIDSVEQFKNAEDVKCILKDLQELAQHAATLPFRSSLWNKANAAMIKECQELYEVVRAKNLPAAPPMGPLPLMKKPPVTTRSPPRIVLCPSGHRCLRRESHTQRNPNRWFFVCNTCNPHHFVWEDQLPSQNL